MFDHPDQAHSYALAQETAQKLAAAAELAGILAAFHCGLRGGGISPDVADEMTQTYLDALLEFSSRPEDD